MFERNVLNLLIFKQRVLVMERETCNDIFIAEILNKFFLEIRGNVLTVYFVICAITFAISSYIFQF